MKSTGYSAFLLQHRNRDRSGFDKEALHRDDPHFVILHDPWIEDLKKLETIPDSPRYIQTHIGAGCRMIRAEEQV